MLRKLATNLSLIAWFFTTGIVGEAIATDCLAVRSIIAPFKNQLTTRLKNEQHTNRFVSAAATTGLATLTGKAILVGAVNAGVTTEATYAGMNYGTDAGKFLKHMTSTDMAKTVLMSMAQGGVGAGVLDASGVSGIESDITRKLATNALRNAVSSGFAVAQGADIKQSRYYVWLCKERCAS